MSRLSIGFRPHPRASSSGASGSRSRALVGRTNLHRSGPPIRLGPETPTPRPPSHSLGGGQRLFGRSSRIYPGVHPAFLTRPRIDRYRSERIGERRPHLVQDTELNSEAAAVACHPGPTEDRGAGMRTTDSSRADRHAPSVPHRAPVDLEPDPDPHLAGVLSYRVSSIRDLAPPLHGLCLTTSGCPGERAHWDRPALAG